MNNVETGLEIPKFTAPAKIYGANISKEVEDFTLILQRVPVVTCELEKVELDGYIKAAKKLRKIGADLRLNETRKLDAVKTMYTDAEKSFFSELDARTAAAEKRINDFNAAQLRKIREEQERIRQEEQARLARLRSPVSMAKVETEFSAKKEAAAASMPTGVRMAWTYEVTHVSQIPGNFILDAIQVYIDNKNELPEFLKLALTEFVRAGGRNLPGVKISEQPIRTGR